MARAFLTISDQATGKIQGRIDIAINVAEDFRPVWAEFKAPWYATRRRMFHTLGRSTGRAWPSYAQTPERNQYRWIKARITGNVGRIHRLKPLHWEGGKERLRPSLETSRHPDSIWRAREDSLEVGTRVPYARNHDRGIGHSPPWRNLRRYRIPKRPLLRFGRKALVKLADGVRDHAAAIARETGGRVEVGFASASILSRLGR